MRVLSCLAQYRKLRQSLLQLNGHSEKTQVTIYMYTTVLSLQYVHRNHTATNALVKSCVK